MEQEKKLFDFSTMDNEKKIFSSIFICGWEEKEILNYFKVDFNNDARKIYPKLKILASFPKIPDFQENNIKLIFPDNEYRFDKPVFFFSSFYNSENKLRYFYSLKFNEFFQNNNNKTVPLAIVIISKKYDYEQFKLYLTHIYQNLFFFPYVYNKNKLKNNNVNNQNENDEENDYNNNITNIIRDKHKKEENLLNITERELVHYNQIELLNIFLFSCINLLKPSPHSTLRLTLPFKCKQNTIDFYYSSNCELPCNKSSNEISYLFSLLDLSLILKIIFKLLTENSVIILSSNINILSVVLPAIKKILFPFNWPYRYYNVIYINDVKKILDENSEPILIGVLYDKNQELKKDLINSFFHYTIDIDTNIEYNLKKFQKFVPTPSSEISTDKKLMMVFRNGGLKKYIDNPKIPLNERYQKVTFFETGKIIIDCDNDNKLFIETKDRYLNGETFSEVRRKLNEARNSINNINKIDNNINIYGYNDIRNEDYKINNVFANLIFDKTKNEQDTLRIDMRVLRNYIKYSIDYMYQNDSERKIIKNTKIYEDEKHYYNSFCINLIINELNIDEFKYFFNKKGFKFDEILNDYKIIKNYINNNEIIYKNLREDYYEENILKFYGEDGVISLFRTLSSFFDEEFYYKCYFKKIFLFIVDILKSNNYKLNNNDENIPIKFNKIKLDEEEKFDIKQKVNFYTYAASVFEENKLYKGYNNIFPDEIYNHAILNLYNKAFKCDKIEFPFSSCYNFLNNISLKDFNELKYIDTLPNIEHQLGKFLEIIRDLISKKVEKEILKKYNNKKNNVHKDNDILNNYK